MRKKNPPLRIEVFLYQLILFFSLPLTQAADQSCVELGFAETLVCSHCQQLKEYVDDGELLAECSKCCIDDSATNQKVEYISAVLEVCQWKLGRFPQIQAFITANINNHPNLKLQYMRGADPILRLKSLSQEETISLASWTTDNLEEFLKQKLMK